MGSPAIDHQRMARAGSPYWATLDGARGLFVLGIFLFHVHPPFVPGASIAVDGFFVLSGFLITFLIVRERQARGRVSLKRFYARRALRLLPVAFVSLALGSVLAYATLPGRRSDIWPAARSVLFYYANFRAAWHPKDMAVFLPAWSLSTEEQFYVVWPLLLVLLFAVRASSRAIVAFAVTSLIASTIWLQFAYERGTALSAIYYRPDLRIGGIITGCTLGLLYAYQMLPPQRVLCRWLPSVTYAGMAYVVVYIRYPQVVPERFIPTLGVSAACFAFAALILHQVTEPVGPVSYVLRQPVTRWLGRVSYIVYLVHVPIIRAVKGVWDPPVLVKGLAAGVLTLAVATVIHYTVERPFLRLKGRFEPPALRVEPAHPSAIAR